MLDYTLQHMIATHQIVIERDLGATDAFGAETRRKWTPHLTLDGLFWWWPSHGEGNFDESADPARNVNLTGGGVLLALGAAVDEQDRVGKVLDADGSFIAGPFRITSVRETEDHLELSLERP